MARALLFINPDKTRARKLADEISAELKCQGFELCFFDLKGDFPFDRRSGIDLTFSLGGDGTVLHAVRNMAPLGVPVFPINLGSFGFIAGIHPENWKLMFEDWRSGKAALSSRLMLEVTVERQGREVSRNICLNETVVSSPGIVKLLTLNVSLGERAKTTAPDAMKFLHLAQYRCDGLIAATPTGSTAHSAAAGGPILDPELEAIILNPICPFTLSQRPLVLPAGQSILIEVGEDQKGEAILSIDGQLTQSLMERDKVYVSR